MEPIINSQVPEFKVQAFQNGSFKTVSSEDIKGKWAIFFFYPADFTFVCPTELVDMADKYGKFQEMGVEVYSVSTDSHFVHKAWHDASETIRKIKYPMLADPTGALSRAFGVMIEEEGMAYRGTFLVNPEGKIKIAEIEDNLDIMRVKKMSFRTYSTEKRAEMALAILRGENVKNDYK